MHRLRKSILIKHIKKHECKNIFRKQIIILQNYITELKFLVEPRSLEKISVGERTKSI